MNFIWDFVLHAREQGESEKTLFFRQAGTCSPYLELALTSLNETRAVGPVVEVNALYRFAFLFEHFLQEEEPDFPLFQAFFYDAVFHLLVYVDLHTGLSKREFSLRALQQDLLGGCFGMDLAKAYGALEKEKQSRLAALLLQQGTTGSSLALFRKALRILYPDSILYQEKQERQRLLLYLPKGKEEESRLEVITTLFLPLSYQLRVFFLHHFGVFGVAATLQLEEIEIY